MNFSFLQKIFKSSNYKSHQQVTIASNFLMRNIVIEVILPPKYNRRKKYPAVIFNDGQDFPALNITQTLSDLYKNKLMPPTVIIGVHCNENRINEYGVANRPDYKNRGNKAKQHNDFIIQELLPFLRKQYNISDKKEHLAMAGFSLGGLSAFDIAWHNPLTFSRVGVFSGSLWWRSKAFTSDDPDGNRIIHEMVSQDSKRVGLKFWFQVGTLDEADDRNNNGVIDAIDDTLDLIQCLREKGYKDEDISYVLIDEGEHNPQTWGKAMLNFLLWVV